MTDKKNRSSPNIDPARRKLLLGGAAVAGGALLSESVLRQEAIAQDSIPDWSKKLGSGVDTFPYGTPSSHESHVQRRTVNWLTPTKEASVNFTPLHELDGIITPNGLCFERHHGGAADIDPAEHSLTLHGLVDRELRWAVDELRQFPHENHIHFLECASNTGMEWRGAQMNGVQFTHGMVHCVEYTGVKLSTLLDYAGVKSNAAWLLVEGADAAGMTRSLPLFKAMDDVLVAWSMNGERLRREQGYPLRLVVPGWEGNLWIKWLRRIEVGDQPWHTREETSRYTDLMPDGIARQFSWVMGVKSVITSPSPQKAMKRKGPCQITGLAWTGGGRIKHVDISVDGGRNWREARLSGLVLPHALTRFYFDWDWHGDEAFIMSRAVDETGSVQPTISQLRKVLGENSTSHNNAIQTWRIHPDGKVENVQLST